MNRLRHWLRCILGRHDYISAGFLIALDARVYVVSLCEHCGKCVSTSTLEAYGSVSLSTPGAAQYGTEWGPVRGSA